MVDKHFAFIVHPDSPFGVFMLPDFYEDHEVLIKEKYEETTFDFGPMKDKLTKHPYKILKIKEIINHDKQDNIGAGVETETSIGDNKAE